MSFSQTLEIFAVIFGLINIYLCIRMNVWNWFFGLVMVSLYAIIFFRVKLYADMMFQIVALSLQIYGLLNWQKASQSKLFIKKITINQGITAIFAISFLHISIAFLLKNYTDSSSINLDAFTTATSLVALWMQAKKLLLHWLLWIVIDIVSVAMYVNKLLYLTAGLYIVFLALSMMGWHAWHKQLKKELHETFLLV